MASVRLSGTAYACVLSGGSNIMFAKSFIALDGNDRLTGARTAQTAPLRPLYLPPLSQCTEIPS